MPSIADQVNHTVFVEASPPVGSQAAGGYHRLWVIGVYTAAPPSS